MSEKYLKDLVFYLEKYNDGRMKVMEGLHGIETKDLQIKEREAKSKLEDYISYLWYMIGVLVLFTTLFIIFKQKQNQAKFNTLMNRQRIENSKDLNETGISQTTQALVIKDEKVAELIRQIARLNEEGFFLKPKTTLYNTAKKLKTNTSYLSNVINNHLNTTFNAFVNEIRINYIVTELKTNNQMRQYSVKAIAEEIGYKSVDSFTKYFKQNTGLSPSLFIKKVNKEH